MNRVKKLNSMPQNMQELVIIGNISLVKVSNWSIIMSTKKRLSSQFSEWYANNLKINIKCIDLVEKSIEDHLNAIPNVYFQEAIAGLRLCFS